jgi:hypothetical protein
MLAHSLPKKLRDTERMFDKYQLALTKEGGIWPILLTDLLLDFELSTEDIYRAASVLSNYVLSSSMLPHATNGSSDEPEFPDVHPSDEPEFPDVHPPPLHDFVRELLGGQFDEQHSIELVNQAYQKYWETLSGLSEMGLIEDPLVEKFGVVRVSVRSIISH